MKTTKPTALQLQQGAILGKEILRTIHEALPLPIDHIVGAVAAALHMLFETHNVPTDQRLILLEHMLNMEFHHAQQPTNED